MGGGSRWGAKGGLKHPFGLKKQCCPINAPQDHKIHPHGSTGSVKGHL